MRLIAPLFLHGGTVHILFNMYMLYQFGPPLEQRLGSSNYGSLYLLSGTAGVALTMLMGTHSSVGASGSLFGVLAGTIAVHAANLPVARYFWRNPEIRHAIWFIVLYIGLGFLGVWIGGGYMGVGRMDNWGHLGGALAGAQLGWLFERWHQRGKMPLLRLMLGLGSLAALIVAARWTVFEPHYHLQLAAEARLAGRTEADVDALLSEGRGWAERRGRAREYAELSAALKNGEWNAADGRLDGLKWIHAELKSGQRMER
jgi:membrane associated rhomboid family serine protease